MSYPIAHAIDNSKVPSFSPEYARRARTMQDMLAEVEQANPDITFQYGMAHELHAYRLIARTHVGDETFVVERLMAQAELDANYDQTAVVATTLQHMTRALEDQIANAVVPPAEARALCAIAGVKPKFNRESGQFTLPAAGRRSGMPTPAWTDNALFVDRDAPMDQWREAITTVVRARELGEQNPDLDISLGMGACQKFPLKPRQKAQAPNTFVSNGPFSIADYDRMAAVSLDKQAVLAKILEVEEAKRIRDEDAKRMMAGSFRNSQSILGSAQAAISANLMKASAVNTEMSKKHPPVVTGIDEAAPIPKSVWARVRKAVRS